MCIRDRFQSEAIPVGFRQDVHKGQAFIRSDVSGEVRDYEIEIQKVDHASLQKNKGMVIRVVDEELLKLTGGIVQGMTPGFPDVPFSIPMIWVS